MSLKTIRSYFSLQGGNENCVLGISYFLNHDSELDKSTTSENCVYNLGNGEKEKSELTAKLRFMEREFPFIFSGQQKAIFLLKCFIGRRPDLLFIYLFKL